MLGAAAVKVALGAGVSGNAALLFGRMCSYNGKPFWELRANLKDLFGVSKRTITRYFAALVEAELIVNKPAPLGVTPPGCKKPLPFRPWFKWAVGLPQLREAVKSGSKEAYARWIVGFEQGRQERVTRSKLGAIIGSIISRNVPSVTTHKARDESTQPMHLSSVEIDLALAKIPPVAYSDRDTPDKLDTS